LGQGVKERQPVLDTDLGLQLDVERGPDWIFIRPHPPEGSWGEAPALAEAVWAILEQSFTYRVVLELDQLALLRSCLIGQLVLLAKRVHSHDGLLRVCGLSPQNYDVLAASRLNTILPNYHDRSEAIMASRPKPR
jgi:anti-anti-sigma factor